MPQAPGRGPARAFRDDRRAAAAGPRRADGCCRRRPYDACEKMSTRATSISMVRYRGNDYSVPVALRPSRGPGPRLCRRSRDRCRNRSDRPPAPAILREGRHGLRPAALPAAPRAEDRAPWTRPRRSRAGSCPRRSPRCRRIARGADGQGGQARVRAGPAALRDLRDGSCPRRRAPGSRPRRHRLRCDQAPGAVPASSGGRPGSISTAIPTCRGRGSRRPGRRATSA